jgi:hypothetical protein
MITLVTGLWDIGRGELKEGWNRSFDYYLERFGELLSVDNNMIIFGDENLKSFVFKYRDESNTQFILKNKDWFKNNEYYPLIQKIRKNPDWYNKTGWLKDSTQAKLELYNPLVMSKIFLLNDAKILDKFNSNLLYWIDAGITNTVHSGYFTNDKVLEKLESKLNKFNFVCFPYEANDEVHGFDFKKMCELSNEKTDLVARGGFFGGDKESITTINMLYYDLLIDTLLSGYMGTEESLFTILLYRHPYLINYFDINSDGLLFKFFEDVKNNNLVVKNKTKKLIKNYTNGVGLYVISFNSPKQFETLIESMLSYDRNFIDKTQKFLLDNSTDLTTTPRYRELCEKYRFEHIKKDNLGICGGRQFVAEHFDNTDLQYMWWSEDDMFFQNKPNETCRNGFNRYIPNLFNKCVEIMDKENFEFLKINYSEFYGDNGTCWPWYNLAQDKREIYFPEKPNLPKIGLDPNAPKTKFNNIMSHKGLPYVDGEIYYCNWTHIISREGNKKMFLDTTWSHPYESTWMSHHYQLTKDGKLNGGLLLLTPVEHNRFDHYNKELRKES